ncbi:hypothetical protein ANSO36C_07440 [Nostoc cf. commune SO-36]|uniref:Uncharacterized protein n=1 Tax=Nostoc cf. commune SO-36 TaxID=449208 RepID=A0ABM7YWB9_NOSCO|nr:hypothetical protein [Nostoc commune]BDI14942.1 hypothetical protein ANSO36C_07440 [Nostoc cf. commune SO-36]
MKIAAKEAFALRALALTRLTSNTSTQNQHLPSVTELRDSGKAATATIKIDGYSTVYAITQAMGYVPLPDHSKRLNYVHLYQGKVGTRISHKLKAFDGAEEK